MTIAAPKALFLIRDARKGSRSIYRIYSQGYDLEGRRGDMLPFYLDKGKANAQPRRAFFPLCASSKKPITRKK